MIGETYYKGDRMNIDRHEFSEDGVDFDILRLMDRVVWQAVEDEVFDSMDRCSYIWNHVDALFEEETPQCDGLQPEDLCLLLESLTTYRNSNLSLLSHVRWTAIDWFDQHVHERLVGHIILRHPEIRGVDFLNYETIFSTHARLHVSRSDN
jgi:hypothetical protein